MNDHRPRSGGRHRHHTIWRVLVSLPVWAAACGSSGAATPTATTTVWELNSTSSPAAPASSVSSKPASNDARLVRFTPDGTDLAIAGADGTIQLQDVRTGTVTVAFQAANPEVRSLNFSPDGHRLAVVSVGHPSVVEIVDVQTGARTARLQANLVQTAPAQFSPDGTSLVTGPISDAADGAQLVVWDAATYQRLRTFTVMEPDGTSGYPHLSYDGGVAFTPDGARLVGVCHCSKGFVWDTTTGKVTTPLDFDTVTPKQLGDVSVEVTADGTRLVIGVRETGPDPAGTLGPGDVMVLDAMTGTLITVIPTGRVTTTRLAADGQHIVVGSDQSGQVTVWDLTSGARTATIDTKTSSVLSVDVSSSGIVAMATGPTGVRLEPYPTSSTG